MTKIINDTNNATEHSPYLSIPRLVLSYHKHDLCIALNHGWNVEICRFYALLTPPRIWLLHFFLKVYSCVLSHPDDQPFTIYDISKQVKNEKFPKDLGFQAIHLFSPKAKTQPQLVHPNLKIRDPKNPDIPNPQLPKSLPTSRSAWQPTFGALASSLTFSSLDSHPMAETQTRLVIKISAKLSILPINQIQETLRNIASATLDFPAELFEVKILSQIHLQVMGGLVVRACVCVCVCVCVGGGVICSAMI